MPADTSIYGALLKPRDPFETATAIQGLGNAQVQRQNMQLQGQNLSNQNALFQQEYNANLAIGKALQSSVKPDGTVDYDAAANAVAKDPQAGFKAGDFLMKVYQGKGYELQNKLSELSIQQKKNSMAADAALGALAEHGDDVTAEDVAKRLSSLHSQYVSAGLADENSAKDLLDIMGHLPAAKGPELAKFIRGLGVSMGASAEALNKVTGAFHVEDVGGSKRVFYENPYTHEWTPVPGQDITKTPTVEAINAPFKSTDAGGGETTQPAIQAVPMYDGAGHQINAPGGGTSPPADAPQQVPMTGASPDMPPGQPAAMAPPGMPPVAPAQAGVVPGSAPPPVPGVAPGTAVTTQLPIIRKGALDNEVEVDKQYAKDLEADTNSASQTLFNTKQLIGLMKEVKTGAGSSVRAKLSQVMQALGVPQSKADGLANGDLSKLQEEEKYLLQSAANALRQNLSNQRITNLEFAQYTKALPNIDTDPRASDTIIHQMELVAELKRREQTAYHAWLAAGHNPREFQDSWIKGLIAKKFIGSDALRVKE